MAQHGYISSDSHMSEPLNLWVDRVDRQYRDRAPHVEPIYDGKEGAWWVYEGYPPHDLAVGVAGGQSRTAEEKIEFMKSGGYADARPGGWDPAERLKDMATDNVIGEVLFTTLGFRLFWLLDPDLQRECFRVYNDWLAEYCSYAPDRFKGLALISLYDPRLGAQELERCAKMGLAGAMIWVTPPEEYPYWLEMYDRFWAMAQELGMVLNFHPPTGMERPKYEFGQEARALRSTIAAHEVQKAMTILIASGVLERFPSLQVVSAEYGVGWAPFWLDQVDKAAGTGPSRRSSFPTKLTMRPTEYFKRQMYITYIDDPVGVRYRHDIGIDKIMWSSDYPHAASTWPKSSEFIERDFAGAPPEEKELVVRGTVSKLYGFEL
ncbi:MAG TPA: amidohydrolase [Candidatus Latescibacteria bacterium]|nr:amidohydrolase [Candidatus Latescibacterota bacterium]